MRSFLFAALLFPTVILAAAGPTHNPLPCLGGFTLCSHRPLCVLFPSDCATLCPMSASSSSSSDGPKYACPDRSTCSAGPPTYLSDCGPSVNGTVWDPTLDADARTGWLLTRLSMPERIAQLTDKAPAVPRLSVPGFNWLNDDEHGVKQPQGTSFPNGVTLGQTWDRRTLREVGAAVSVEARGIFNADVAEANNRGTAGNSNGIGVTLYAPNMNLVRNPLWGRAQEVYSEDPVLTGTLTEAFVNGVQLVRDGRLMSLACCKHFAAYDLEGPAPTTRFNFSASVDARNMLESYLPAFEYCVRRAGGRSVMCSYNSINGVPTCGDPNLLNGLLRGSLGFDGFVVSDYDAWANMVSTHHYAGNLWDAAKIGIEAGMDQEGGGTSAIDKLWDLVNDGSVQAGTIDKALTRLLRARIELGLFDPPGVNPFGAVSNGTDTVASETHLSLAFEAAAKGIVLRYNNDGALPINDQLPRLLQQSGMQRIPTDMPVYAEHTRWWRRGERGAVPRSPLLNDDGFASAGKVCLIGPQGNMTTLLQGNYAVPPERPIETILEAMFALYPSLSYTAACSDGVPCASVDTASVASACAGASAAVVTVGLDQTMERETHDRSTLELPRGQMDLISAVRSALPTAQTPLVAVLIRGGTVIVNADFRSKVTALIDAGYPGERGGAAIAAVIAGLRNPSGKTAVTYYASDDDLPPIQATDFYTAPGVTYRYSTRTPVFAFGTGLSYSKFSLQAATASKASYDACEDIDVAFTVANLSPIDGETVVQVYVRQIDAQAQGMQVPIVRLADYARVAVSGGTSAGNTAAASTVSGTLTVGPQLRAVVKNGGSIYDTSSAFVGPGKVEVIVGIQGPFDQQESVVIPIQLTGNSYRVDECQ